MGWRVGGSGRVSLFYVVAGGENLLLEEVLVGVGVGSGSYFVFGGRRKTIGGRFSAPVLIRV